MSDRRTEPVPLARLLPALPGLVAKNLLRHLPRLYAMGLALTAVFALLVVGNAVLLTATEGFRGLYTRHLTGDLVISAPEAQGFTLFGSQAFLVGEFDVPVTVVNAPEVLETLRDLRGVQDAAGVVSARARVEVSGRRDDQVLFGVSFPEYERLFPDLELVKGEFPDDGRPAILLQEERYQELSEALGEEPELGEPVLLTAASAQTFTIREVELAGVYRYPAADPQIEQAALIDAPTARALNGHVAGSPGEAELTEQQQRLLDAELDDMFGTRDDEPTPADDLPDDEPDDDDPASLFDEADEFDEPADEPDADEPNAAEPADDPLDPDALFGDPDEDAGDPGADEPGEAGDPADLLDEADEFDEPADEPEAAERDELTLEMVEEIFAAEAAQREAERGADRGRRDAAGTYNFLLVRTEGRLSTGALERRLVDAGFSEGQYLVRGWRSAAGGSAMLVTLLQLMLNLGLGFITIAALAVTTNALVLSVLERGRELGTLRAMGAQKSFLGLLIAGESAGFVLVCAALGTLLGTAGAAWLNAAALELENPLLTVLFGGEVLVATVTPALVAWHVAGALLLSLLAVLYPLKRVMGVSPVRAMAGEAQHA